MTRRSRENTRSLYEIAATQSGYFTAAQARQVGYAYSQQHFHVTHGNWLKIDRGIFRLRDFPPAEREDLARWSLWSCDRRGIPQAVVSHETALAVHELSDVLPEQIHLTVPPSFRKKTPPGVRFHTAALAPSNIQLFAGYRVTTALCTLLDVAASPLSQEHLDQAVRQALERGLVRRNLLERADCSPKARHRLDRALAAARGAAL